MIIKTITNIIVIILIIRGGFIILEQFGTIMIPEEVCEVLRIGTNECYKMLKEGQIKAYKVGKTWRIPKANLEHYINTKITGFNPNKKN